MNGRGPWSSPNPTDPRKPSCLFSLFPTLFKFFLDKVERDQVLEI